MAAEILWEAFRLRPAYKNAAESELLMKLKYLAHDPSFPTPSAEIMAAFDEAKVALERRDAQRRSGNGRVYCDPATKASLQQLLNLVKKDDDTKRLEEEEKASAAAWRDKYTMVLMEKNLLAEQYGTLKLQMEALQREHVEMKLKLQSGVGSTIPAEDVKVITNADSTWGVEKKDTGGDDGKKKRPSPPSTRAKKATTVAATKRQKLEVVAAAPVPAFHFHEPALTTINETTDQLFGSLLVKKNGDDDSDYLTIGLSDLESQCGSQGV